MGERALHSGLTVSSAAVGNTLEPVRWRKWRGCGNGDERLVIFHHYRPCPWSRLSDETCPNICQSPPSTTPLLWTWSTRFPLARHADLTRL